MVRRARRDHRQRYGRPDGDGAADGGCAHHRRRARARRGHASVGRRSVVSPAASIGRRGRAGRSAGHPIGRVPRAVGLRRRQHRLLVRRRLRQRGRDGLLRERRARARRFAAPDWVACIAQGPRAAGRVEHRRLGRGGGGCRATHGRVHRDHDRARLQCERRRRRGRHRHGHERRCRPRRRARRMRLHRGS